MDYYALMGNSGEAYGLIRRNGSEVDRFDLEEKVWKFLPDGMKYFNGDNSNIILVNDATVRRFTGESRRKNDTRRSNV